MYRKRMLIRKPCSIIYADLDLPIIVKREYDGRVKKSSETMKSSVEGQTYR